MPRCGIVILAAGASVRMGVPKQSLTLEGVTLLERAVRTALASVCRPVVVVLGANAEKLRGLLRGDDVTIVVNPDWSAGMGTSIRCGIAAIQSQAIDAAMIFLCDQPLISAEILNRMVETHFAGSSAVTAASYADTIGTPMIFSASVFEELLAIQDSQGGKAVANRHADKLATFALPEAEMDIDTPADFGRVRAALEGEENTNIEY